MNNKNTIAFLRELKIIKVLKIRPFLFLLLAEIFSQLATNMLNFVLIIVAFTVASSNTAVSGVILSFTIPSLLFGLLAGVYVDKWSKRKVLIVTNILRAALVFLLVFLHVKLLFIYLLSFAISLVSQFFVPAEPPMIPLLVRRELLLSANAVFGIIIYASIFIAYAISGPLLLVTGKIGVFIILSASFFLAAIFASAIKVKKAPADVVELKPIGNIFSEMRNAFSFIAKAKKIYQALFLLTLAQILVLVLAVIGPGYADQVLKIKVEQFPLFFVTPAIIGMALGAVILGSFFHKHKKRNITRVGLLLLGLSILALPYGSKVESRQIVQTINSYVPHFFEINILHIMVVLSFIMGIANSLIFVPSQTVLQEETSDEIRGKIYGALNTMVGFFSLLPIIIVGGLADLIGIKSVITGLGLIVLFIAVLSIISPQKK